MPTLILDVKFTDGWEVITQDAVVASILPRHQLSRLARAIEPLASDTLILNVFRIQKFFNMNTLAIEDY